MATANGTAPKLTFYTNHGCPWAQRAQIALKALNIPYEEVIIPLDRPRGQWYLDINPRGLVPALKFSSPSSSISDAIIVESTIVATFLADAFPDPNFWPHVTAGAEAHKAALERAKITFFVDTWFGKVNPLLFPLLKAHGHEAEEKGKEFVKAVEKEIEPLLKEGGGGGKFFGGREKIGLAEALTGSFIIRLPVFAKHGLLPSSLLKGLEALPTFGKWMDAVSNDENVKFNFDGNSVAKGTRERLEKMK